MSKKYLEDQIRKKKREEEEAQEEQDKPVIRKPGARQQNTNRRPATETSQTQSTTIRTTGGYPQTYAMDTYNGDLEHDKYLYLMQNQHVGYTGDPEHDMQLAQQRQQYNDQRAQISRENSRNWFVGEGAMRIGQVLRNGFGAAFGQTPDRGMDLLEQQQFFRYMEQMGNEAGDAELSKRGTAGLQTSSDNIQNYLQEREDKAHANLARHAVDRLTGKEAIPDAGTYSGRLENQLMLNNPQIEDYYGMYQLAAAAGDKESADRYLGYIQNLQGSNEKYAQEARDAFSTMAAPENGAWMMPRDWRSKTTQEKADYWEEQKNRGIDAFRAGVMLQDQDLMNRATGYMGWTGQRLNNATANLIGEKEGPAAEYAYRYNQQELEQKKAEAEAAVAARKKAMENADKVYELYALGEYKPQNPTEDPEAAYYQAKQSYENAQAEVEIWKKAIDLEKGDEFARLEKEIPEQAKTSPEVQQQIEKGQQAFLAHEKAAFEKAFPGRRFYSGAFTDEQNEEHIREILSGNPSPSFRAYSSTTGDILKDNGYSEALVQNRQGFGMTDDQKATFFWLYATDPEKAEEFAEACKKNAEDASYAAKSAAETSPLMRVLKEFGAANMKLFFGLAPGTEMGEWATKEANAMTASVGAGREKYGVLNTGFLSGKLDEDIPLIGGKSLNDWTQLKSSMIMSGETAAAAKIALATGHPEAAAVIEVIGLYMQSGAAANDDYIRMKELGWDDDKALTHALFAGLAEGVFEKVSLDKLLDQNVSRGLVRNLLTQAGVEASEEVTTSIANHITDAVQSKIYGYDNDRERRAKAYMADGLSYNEAYNKAHVDIMTDLLEDALGGFISGGLMTGGNYASMGLTTTAGKVVSGIRNTRDIYTGANLVGMGEDVNLHQKASEGAVNQTINDKTGGTTTAMQAYAEKNGLTLKDTGLSASVETTGAENATPAAQTSNDAQTRSDDQKVSRRGTRAVKQNVEAVTNSIADKMYSKSENVEGRMAGAVAVYNETVQEYGEGIKPVAQAALRNTVNKIVTETGDRGNVSATTAFQEQVGKIENPEARDVAQEALDYAVYRKTTNATQRSEVMEGFRHLDESSVVSEMRAQRNKARGDMTMQATVTDENGQSKAVDITGITEDGKAVELSDGVKIDVKDLQADADTKDAIQMIASMELGTNADKVLQAYRDSGLSGTEGYRFIADYTQAIEQGRTNRVSLERATKSSSLDAKTVMEAYTIGQQIAHAETQKAMDRLKNAPKKKGATGRTATIDTSAIEGVTMSQSEREQFELANRIFSALGVDLRWVASSEKNGRFVGANGSYLNGTVTLDIHAGRNFLNDVRSGILATTGHELTHFLEQYAPEQYKALKEFVFQQIVQNGKYGEETLERLIQEKKRRAKGRISQREAENEVVADACQNMLLDSKAVSRFAQEHEDAAKGIVRWLDKWFGKLKSAITGSRLSEEARMMNNLEKDVKQAFGDLWDKALEEAVEVHDRVGNIEKPQQQQNSDRDTEYLEAVENDDMATAQKMVRAAAKKAGYNSPNLYHGSSAFGFTSFNMEKSFGQIFATTSIKTAKTYSGETKLMRLSDQVKLDVDALHGDALLEAANKYLDNRYDKLKLLTDTEKKAGLQKAQNNITKLAQKAAEFRQKRADRFDAELSGIYEKMTDALNRIASAQTEDDYEAAYKQYDDALWDFKWKDGNLFSQYIWDVPSKDVLNAYRDGSDFLYQGDLYRYTDTDGKWAAYLGNGLVFDNQMALELDAELHKGVYQLYGRMGKKLTIDANGANWNAIVTPEELHLDRPSKTRTIAEKAFALGYDSVEIKNVRDNSDGTDWRGISDVYIFNAKNAVKSADPVTYDDAGNVIPLSERFNTENQDIRYSERDELASDNRVHDITNRSGDTVGIQDGNGHLQFSQRTWRESGKEKMQEYLDERVRKYEANRNDPEGMHPDDAKALMDAVQEQYDALDEIVRQQPGNYKTYEEWADAEVETDIFGNPVFSWLKANGDYGISGDASLICVKRRTLDAVFDYMIRENMIQDGPEGLKLAQESIVAINDIIRAHGFETACSTCYIDARRYRAAIVAGSFCNVYNKLVRSMLKGKTGVPINAFNFGGNKSVTPLANSLDTLSDSEINWDGINKAIRDQEAKWESKGWEKFTEDGEEKWRRNGTVKNLPTSGTTEYRIALALKEKPSLRKLALRSDFLSGNGFLELNRTNKDILTLYNVKKGQAGPKATETDIQYLHEALENSFITPDRMFKAGGFRLQSFSDYVPRLVFDYVEIIGDLAAKGVPAHMYTKEILCVLQHGLTGTKINMSLIPAMVKKGIAPGLDADGNYLWRDGQTFGSTAYSLSPKLEAHLSKILGYQVKGRLTGAQGFELAKLIQNDPAYGKNNGTIAIGVSEAQIRKMLDDADIRMVIPYHKSGLNHILASMMEIPGFENYESYQNTLKWNGTKWTKVDVDFDFNEAVQKHKGDARAAAQDYLDWCEENRYKPKFSGVASGSARNSYNKAYDFTQHADWQTGTMTGEAESNYYKVLADFTCYDAEGKVSRQEAVKLNYPGTDSAFGSMKQLIEMGLESDAMLQAKQDAEVPKIVDDIRREIPKFEAAGRNMKAYAQLKENVEGRQYSVRDYDNTVSDVDLLLQQNVEDAANLEQGRLLKEFQAKAKQVQDLEAKLEKAKADLKRTDRSYNTRGIQKLVGGIMKTFGMGDAKNLGIQKTAAETLQKAYDKAIAAIDRGESPMEIVYQGALDLADYLLENGTYREKQGFKWDRAKWAQVYANTEEARQHAVDEVVSAVYQDFGMNRYREAVQATAVDRIVDRVENRYNQKLDAVKAENKALQQANDKLQAEQKILKEIEDQQRTVVNNLNETLQDTRAELKQARKDNSKDVKRLEQKVSRLAGDLRTAKERVRSWEEKAKHLGNYSQALIDSKNRDIRDLRQKLNAAHAELQAAASQIEEMKGWEEKAKHAGVYSQQLIDSKNRDIAKLEKEIQKHRDILAGKLRNPQLTAMLKAAKEAQYEKDQEAKEAQFAGYKDRKNRTSIRNRIKNLHAEMNRDLLRPREGHFVPEKLIRPVVDLLDLVNTETNRAKSESAQARIAAINAAYDAIKKDERYSQYYDETVKDMLVELSGTLAGRSIYDLTTAELEDVYTVMKAMRTTIRNAIKADLIEKGKEIWEIGNEMRQELRAGRGAHALQLLEKYHMTMLSAKRAFNRFGGYQQSSAWNKVYRMLDDAQLKMLTLEMQGTRIFDRVLEGKENLEKAEKLTSYREDDLVDVGLKDETGKAVPIPRGMMLSLYMHLQNEENMRHLMYGGITLPDFKRYYKGRSEAWGQGTVSIPALGARVAALDELFTKGELSDAEYEEAYKEHKAEIDEIFDSIRTAIEEQLTDYDRQWIAASREFFDGFSRRELNRVTNEMYGFSKARVDNYFPIVTDSDFLKSEFESISKNISLENAGFMKERVRASNPIHLEDITKAVNRQISNVSRYAGLTQALKTFGNVYNVQDRGFTDSVKKAMAKTYGKNGQQYVENLITDMVGGRNTPGTIFDRVKGNYAQAVLAANLSVTIKQAASFPTAAATVGWGPLMKALARGGKSNLPISRADSNLISIYSPLLWYRSKGAIDVEIGDIANGRDWTQKAKWLMGWIEKTDRATVGRLWYAAEYYVKDNYNLEKGTEEQIKNGESPFYRKVAEVFADIVEDTQPNYTILQRPDILRNPNKLVRAMVMFSTQRFQNGNILIDAIGEYRAMVRADKQNGTPQTKAARKAARQKLTRAISSQTVSAMVLSAMTLLAGAVMHRMNPWRDDDDELTFESIAEEYLNGFLSSLTGSFLAGSEVYEGLQAMLTGSKYYGNDVGGISTINELATAVIQFEQQAVKLIGDEDSTAKDWQNLAEKQLWKVGEYLSQMTGIPTANIKKIIEGGRNHIADIMNEEFFSFEAGVDRSTAVNARRYYKAWMSGDNAKVRDVLKELRDSGKSEDAIRNAISKQAKTAYEEGNIDIDQYAELLDRTGYWDEEKLNGKVLDIVRDEYVAGARTEKEAVDLLIRYNAKVENEDDAWKILQRWETTAEHKGEEDYHYSEYEDLIKDLDAGKTFDEAAAAYLDHGYEEKNLRSNAVSHTKELYQAGKLTDDEAIDQILDYAWKKEDGAYRKLTENEAWMKIKEWRESAGHEEEEDYHYTQYDAIDEAISSGQDIKGLVKELTDHGVKADNVTSHIKGYLIDQYIAGNSTEAKLKNQLSKYLGLTGGEERDEIVRDANCKKLTGYDYGNLGKGYKAGKIPSQTATKALTQYGGMSSSDAKARVRYWDFQKSYPDSNLGQTTLDKYYDTTIENVGRTLQGSGIGLDAYIRYAEAASKAKGTDKDGDGKTDSGSKKAAIMQIIDKLNITTAQKDALYYFNGWSAKTIKEAPWH
ncbi:MAG: hypothetical protein IJK29_11085 [Bacteroidales bacterium]|nr:hypothetical protein [Bacteroidales bacterium]